MAHPLIDKIIKLNHKGLSLKEIGDKVDLSWPYIWKIIHNDRRYRPGKRGFARLSHDAIKRVASKGGIKSNMMIKHKRK